MISLRKHLKQGVVLTIALTVMASSMVGCVKKEKDTSVENKRFAFDMMNIYYNTEPPTPENALLQEIENYTNTDLNVVWVPRAAYDDKVAVTLASGEMPKVILATRPMDMVIVNGVRSGMFWEIGPYLKDYPNLNKKLNSKVLESLSIDGKIYSLYRSRPITRDAVIYRKDWLKNLGLQEPKTIEDVYNMIKAFTLNDPDQNGVNDTVGLIEMKGIPYSGMVAQWFGAPNGWTEDGTPDFATEEYLNMLKWYKRLYQEKLLNLDFAVVEEAQRQQQFLSGKAGVKLHIWESLNGSDELDLKKIVPNAELDGVSRIQGPKGERSRSWGGYAGAYMFPKTSVKTEAELKQILTFFDKLCDVKIQNMMKYGIEGTNYKVENGKAERFGEKIDPRTGTIMDQLYIFNNDAIERVNMTEIEIKSARMLIEDEKIAVYNPFAGLISQTHNEKGAQIQKNIEDAKVKYVMGAIDDNGWKQEIEKWKANGGEKISQELKAEYEKRKK